MAQDYKNPEMAIDLHGIREALSSKNNQIRANIVDGIQSGKIVLLKGVSEELKAIDEALYKDFQNINPKKYIKLKTAHQAHAAMLAEQNGSNIFSACPPTARFEALALCMKEGLTLVSAKKAHKECKGILNKCQINGQSLLDVSEV